MRPTDEEDRAFWGMLVIANVWLATDTPFGRLVALPFLLCCAWMRWPIWMAALSQRAGTNPPPPGGKPPAPPNPPSVEPDKPRPRA